MTMLDELEAAMTGRHSRETLSAVDAAWLRMDRPTNLMMICGMMLFDGRVDLDRMKQVIETRMLCFHRFRQRVVGIGGTPAWQDDPWFDLDWHVRRIAVPRGRAGGGLERVVSDLVSTPLDPTKPMWQFHLVDRTDGSSALVLRVHHCYGDGFALMHVVDAITDGDPSRPHAVHDLGPPEVARSAWERVLGPVAESMGDAIRTSVTAVELGVDMFMHPWHVADYARKGTGLAIEAAVIAGMTSDSPTRFKGGLGVIKRVAWSRPIALRAVKAVAHAFGCTANDVLVACASGALRAYLLDHGEPVTDVEVRALVPVNLREPGPVTELGNHFGLVFLSLPLGMSSAIGRLLEIHRRMDALKHSQQPLVALGILAGMGSAPDLVREKLVETLASNASMVITNVRGHEDARYFAGKRIERQMFWVPQSGGIGLGLSLLSYRGTVSFGVMSDAHLVPDPETVAEQFGSELEFLLLGASV